MRTNRTATTTVVFFTLAVSLMLLVGCAAYGLGGYKTYVNLSGQVVGEDDQPLTGVAVIVTPPNSTTPMQVVTDEAGFFFIKNMPLGKATREGSGGLATITIEKEGCKPFLNKYPITALPSVNAALTTENVGKIKLLKA